MISTVSGYQVITGANVDAEHPHGDLDRIRIRGNVMPRRSSPRRLMGEDVAFLAECICSRNRSSFSGHTSFEFSRSLPASYVEDILIPNINSMFGMTYIRPAYEQKGMPSGQSAYDSNATPDNAFPIYFWNKNTGYPLPVPSSYRVNLDDDIALPMFNYLDDFFYAYMRQISTKSGARSESIEANFEDYNIETPIENNGWDEGNLPSVDVAKKQGYIRYFHCMGSKVDNSWIYFVQQGTASGDFPVRIIYNDADLPHVASVRPIYVISWNNFGTLENGRAFGTSHSTVVLGATDYTRQSNGTFILRPQTDANINGMMSQYGSPTERPPSGSGNGPYQCIHRLKIEKIYLIIRFSEDIGTCE